MGEVRLPWEAQPIRDRTLFKPHGGGNLFRVPCQEKGVSDFCSPGCSVLAVSLIYMFHFRMTPFLVVTLWVCAVRPSSLNLAPSWRAQGRVDERGVPPDGLGFSPIAVAPLHLMVNVRQSRSSPLAAHTRWSQHCPLYLASMFFFFPPGYVSLSYRIKFFRLLENWHAST